MSIVNAVKMNLSGIATVKRLFFLLLLSAAVSTFWCTPGFAVQNVAGAGSTALDATGVTEGVAMTAGAGTGTLTVGAQDIFTNNAIALAAGTAVSTDASSTHNITFNGDSTVNGTIGTAGAFFSHLDANDSATTVTFRGTVFTTTMDVGIVTVNFNSGTLTNLGALSFTGDGTVSLAENTRLTGALTTLTANTGTLSLGSGSILNGAVGGANGVSGVNVVGGSNTAGVTATITGRTETNSLSLLTNTLSITGALEFHNAGVINTTIASATVYGNVSSAGGAFEPGAAVTVNVLVPSSAVLTVGTQFDIVEMLSSPGGAVVTVTIQNPTNPLYTFAPVPAGGTAADGKLTLQLTGTPLTSVASPVLQNLENAPEVQAAINALTSTAAVANASAQLDPTNNGTVTQVSFNTVNEAMSALTTHLGEAGNNPVPGRVGGGISTGDFWKDNGVWVKGFGEKAEQDTHKGVNGYESSMWGVIGGMDGVISHDVLLGVAGGYAETNVGNKGESGGTDIESYIGTIYVSYDDPTPWYGDMGFTFTWNSYDSHRRILFPGIDRTAESSPDGQTYTGFWDLGYVIPVNPDWNITPIAGLTYSHTEIGEYTETGADNLNLTVKSQDYDQLLSSLGARIDATIKNGLGKWVPEAHFRWLYDFIGDQVATTSTFTSGGAAFDTKGLEPEQSTYNLGAGITFYSKGNMSITATYDYRFGTDFSSHTGLGTVRWTF